MPTARCGVLHGLPTPRRGVPRLEERQVLRRHIAEAAWSPARLVKALGQATNTLTRWTGLPQLL
jgi:hypothetical protein